MVRKQTVPFVFGIALATLLATVAGPFLLPALAQEDAVWCFDVVIGANGSRQTFGHPPTAAEPSSVAQSAGGVAVERHCFDRWAEAAAYITDGAVVLADDATEEDYVRETDRFFRTIAPTPTPTPASVPGGDLRSALESLVDGEVEAKNAGDWDAFLSIVHPAASDRWLDQQQNLLGEALAGIYLTRIEQEGDWALAAAVETYREEEGHTAQVYTTRTFRQAGPGDWRLASPSLEAWGEPQQSEAGGLQWRFHHFDEPYVRAIAPRVPVILAQMAAGFDVALDGDDVIAVQVAPFPADEGPAQDALAITVPSPLAPGFPLSSAQSPEEFLLGSVVDVLGHTLVERGYGEGAAEPGRMALAHTAIQREVEQALGRDSTARPLAQVTGAPTPLSDLLDPTVADATGSRPAEQHLFLRFAVARYGRAILPPFLQAACRAGSAEELVAAALPADLPGVEELWEEWFAAQLAAQPATR